MFKSKIKKFLDFFHKGQPSSECNDPEVKALLEAGERIKRSAFHSSPASSNFQAKLLAEIKEKRRLNQNSMQDKIGIWMREFFHPTRLKAAVAFVVLVAVVATTFHFWPGQEGQWSRLLIDTAYAHDNFEVEPTKSDSIGIEGDTAFVIKSKVAIDRGTLEKNIKLFPEVKFELQQVNDKEFKLVPKEELKPKTVYRVYITSSYVNENGITTDRNYSWAFQVKNIFKIMHTLPRDRASGVPINSGIEVTFSHENVKDFEKNFSITPKAIGRFEYHKRTAVFVPKGLTPGIIYTVTIKKGVGIKDSKETLERGTTFQFETMPSEKQENSAYRSFYFSNNFVEFDTAHEPALPAYFHSSDRNAASSSVHITVYAYPSAEEFAKSIEEYYRVPNWADYNRKEQREDPKRLVKIQSFTTQEYTHGYQSFILFPEKLTAGFYLVEGVLAGTNEQPRQMFLQITDLASYLNVNTNKTLLWINDMTTGKPVSGAHVVSTDKKISVSTDGSGVATFETGQLGKPVKDYYSLERYLTVQSGSKSAVVPVTVYDDTYYGADSFDDYWSYLYTDRQLYQGNDTVNVWGFLERRDKKAIEEPLTVEIVSGGYDYFGDSISIAAASVQLEKNGSWTTKLPLQNVKPGVYYMNLKVGDTFLTARTIMVEKYVKPAYSLEVTPDKRAVFLGEKMAFSVSAKFFEGTPLTNLKLAYKIENQRGEVTTDATGKARLEFDSATFSRYATLDVWPYDAEEAEIAGSASVEIFPAKINVDAKAEQVNDATGKVTVQINHVDLDSINRGEAYEYRGAPAKNSPFSARVTESTYNRREVGEYYDFINKVTHKRYEYDKVKKVIAEYDGVTNEKGIGEYQFPIDLYKSYQVEIFASDSEGKAATSEYAYIYTVKGYEAYNAYQEFYNVKVEDDTVPGFSIGETVPVSFTKNGQPIDSPTGSFLFLKQQRGLVDYALTANSKHEFAFAEKDIPNVYMDAVWFDGKLYHKTENQYWMWDEGDYYNSTIVRYKIVDKELKVAVVPDKQKYAPGEEVKLRVKVTDKKGDAAKTNVNLNLVDEAFYQLSYEIADPLPELYGNVNRGGLYAYSSHEYLAFRDSVGRGGAEGGGCFLGGTKIKMADGTEKDIEDIREGDTILTFADAYRTKLVPAKVSKTYQHLIKKYLVINNRLFVTPEHRIFVNHTWRQIGDAKVGDVLLDYRGSPIRIESIEVRNEVVPVYNFEVEGFHTYIADGIYVHNDKGGERQNFTDVALFQTVETDYRGEAEVKFKLPDNLTSWRVTSQAISDDLYAGVSVTKLPVSLPFFADATLASEYLVSDKPIVKARAFGESLKTGDKVNVTFESESLKIAKQNKAGEAFKPVYMDIPALTLGEHALKVGVERGSSKDVLVRKIQVIPSRVEERTQDFYELKEGSDITGSKTERTKLVFSDKNRGQYYSDLWNLYYYYGARVDQKLSEVESNDLLSTYFPEDPVYYYRSPSDFDPTLYQTEEGGISLLPYSGAEFELSTKVTALAGDRFDQVALSNYFYGTLNDQKANTEELAQALFGLASLGEPVLLPVKNLLQVEGLTVRDRLYLALAAERLGDSEFARDIYEKVIKEYGEELKPYLRLKAGKDQDDYISNTILAAWLGAALGDDLHESMWRYAQKNYTKDILINLEELVYLKLALPNLPNEPISFTVMQNGKSREVKLEKSEQATLEVTPEELKNLKFSNIHGRVGVVSIYDRPVTAPDKKKNSYVSVERRYSGRAESGNRQNFKEGELVRVTLTTKISDQSIDGMYQVTDFVPSGLRVITRTYEQGLKACYPYEIDGQEVKFLIGKNSSWSSCDREIVYFARVVNPGTYTAEPAIIQSLKSTDIKNYSSKGEIVITP